MLQITVTYNGRSQLFLHGDGPVEFGRSPVGGGRRIVLRDPSISRDQLRLEAAPDGRVRLTNLSGRQGIAVEGGPVLEPGGETLAGLPLALRVGQTRLMAAAGPDSPAEDRTLQTITAPLTAPAADLPGPGAVWLGDSPTPETLACWMETLLALQRLGADADEVYRQAARALVELIGLDLGMVLLRRGDDWDVAAAHAAVGDCPTGFSRTLVEQVARQQRTFYQDLSELKLKSGSLTALHAAAVSPVFGPRGEVAGVLYGVRVWPVEGRAGVRALEAQLVQLLAAGVGAQVARAAAVRTRVQFEQFFSPELVREMERRPDFLDDRTQDVTVLAGDLRGFTALSERLEATVTCGLIRDLLERLSYEVLEWGGVIVDYAGDGLLAMWNAPVAQPDHAERACRAALGMRRAMAGVNDRWRAVVGTPLELGVGLNSGPAQVGNMGSSRKFKYGPHGYTVNLASRIQAATKQVGAAVLLSTATRDAVAGRLDTRPVGTVALPGIEHPVELHALAGGA